jgi:cell wall-associated NlpC family hydrolase
LFRAKLLGAKLLGARTLGIALIGMVTIAVLPAAAFAAPQNPSDGQIAAAAQAKAARARDVGRLQGMVAKADGDIARLGADAELAGERYNKAVADYGAAQQRAAGAKAAATAATARVTSARATVGKFARSSYMQGSMLGSSTALLSASGPADLVERAGLLQAAGEHHLTVLDGYQSATVAKANADSTARSAVQAMRAAQATAAKAKAAAEAKVTAARTQLAALQARKTSLEGQLVQARARLTGLVNARQAYLTWKREQEAAARRAAIARAKAAAAARAAAEQAAANARADAAARARAAAEAQSRAQAAAQQAASQQAASQQAEPQQAQPAAPAAAQPDAPPAVTMSAAVSVGWTAAKGSDAVAAAMRWLGTPYAWSGGTASGPSYGTAPDTGILGFDCSGLALYAWAQEGVTLPHFSGYQYDSGSHPSKDSLLPGDLLFWSYDGTPSSIHHVAIYVGDGQVLEAPESGDVVKIVPIWYDGLVGATRPGS